MDESQPYRICILGMGGVGGYFGGLMASKIEEEGLRDQIFFIARGRHLEEIRANGLILNTTQREGIRCKPLIATDRMEEIPSPDVVLVCVKSYDLEEAIRSVSPGIKEQTILIPLLNGVDICDRIRGVTRKGILLAACAYVGTHIEKPGVVTQRGAEGIIICGQGPDSCRFDPTGIVALFNRTGLRFQWMEDPYPAIWEKYIFIAGFGLATAYSGKTLGEVAQDRDLTSLAGDIMAEIVSIAVSRGIELPHDIVTRSLAKAANFPHETRTSYQRDVEKGGKNEGDLFGSTVLRMGRSFGIPTPVTERVYSVISARTT